MYRLTVNPFTHVPFSFRVSWFGTFVVVDAITVLLLLGRFLRSTPVSSSTFGLLVSDDESETGERSVTGDHKHGSRKTGHWTGRQDLQVIGSPVLPGVPSSTGVRRKVGTWSYES